MKRLGILCALLLGSIMLAPRSSGVLATLAGARTMESAGINFNILPASQSESGPVKRYFAFVMTPGQSLTDALLVVNPSKTSSLTVTLSVSDATTARHNGGLAFNDAHQQQKIGRWLQLTVASVTVPPYSMTKVPLTLTLPPTLPPGEYEGAINATNTSPDVVTAGKYKVGIYMNRRCIVQVRVNGVAPIGLAIARVGVTGTRASSTLGFTLTNTGTEIDYPTALVATFAGAHKTYTVQARVGQVFGGDSTEVNVAIGRTVPPGNYRTTITVTYAVTSSGTQRLRATWSGRLVVR